MRLGYFLHILSWKVALICHETSYTPLVLRDLHKRRFSQYFDFGAQFLEKLTMQHAIFFTLIKSPCCIEHVVRFLLIYHLIGERYRANQLNFPQIALFKKQSLKPTPFNSLIKDLLDAMWQLSFNILFSSSLLFPNCYSH